MKIRHASSSVSGKTRLVDPAEGVVGSVAAASATIERAATSLWRWVPSAQRYLRARDGEPPNCRCRPRNLVRSTLPKQVGHGPCGRARKVSVIRDL
jgi:hypothetical protein